VEAFVQWLRAGRMAAPPERCQRVEDAAVWYCSKREGFALFERLHGMVQDGHLHAARLAREKQPGSAARLEEASWWLSRAALGDEDIYRAAAGLRRAGSRDWQAMLREGLRQKSETERMQGLADAERLLADPPDVVR
jgi:hypothetical protein